MNQTFRKGYLKDGRHTRVSFLLPGGLLKAGEASFFSSFLLVFSPSFLGVFVSFALGGSTGSGLFSLAEGLGGSGSFLSTCWSTGSVGSLFVDLYSSSSGGGAGDSEEAGRKERGQEDEAGGVDDEKTTYIH